jgi:hypothetical protein
MAAMIIKIADNGICADRGISGMVARRARETAEIEYRMGNRMETARKTASFEYRPPVARPERLSIIRG